MSPINLKIVFLHRCRCKLSAKLQAIPTRHNSAASDKTVCFIQTIFFHGKRPALPFFIPAKNKIQH
ncbi:hypothetical protein [Conchiformibius steedae]|uniref:hypothetical protein n=1 Tax=Conchiformibius steedae TaxID=153493 RepID=UPI0012EBAB29